MTGVQNILERMGYTLIRESSKFWRAKPLYRKSGNPTSLRIDRETGYFWDWSANISGPFNELVRLSLGLSTLEEARKWLKEASFSHHVTFDKPRLDIPEKFELEFVESLLPNYDFYTNPQRNVVPIHESLLRRLRSGVKMDGKQNNRFVFPIFDESEESIEGLAGRDLLRRDIKWKLQGRKSNWLYPAFLTAPYVSESKEVVLVESIGDFLSLATAGFPQVMILFGVKLSSKLLNWLTTSGAKRVIISTNNDFEKEKNENVGKLAASKIESKLQTFFEPEAIQIALPKTNDFGVSSLTQIHDWASEINLTKYEKLSF